MAHRVILVGRSEITSAAMGWAAAGLIGDALWLDADSLGLDIANPTRVPALLLGPGREPAERSLAAELADTRDLTDVRVVWVRDSPHGADSGAMDELKEWIRRRVPKAGCDARFVDLVVPTDAADQDVPEAPPEWQQFRVTPEDRPAPALADAGFPAGEPRIAVAMHAAAALAGILGGTAAQVDGLEQADQQPVWNMHAFSRLVGGGDRLAQAAADFRDRVLPTWSAAEIEDPRFVGGRSEDAEDLLSSVADWWTGEADGVAAYRRPPSHQLAPPEKIRLTQHLRNVATFSAWAVQSLFRFTPADARHWATANHPLDSEDQGYRIEREVRIEESDLPDWASQDAALRARIRASLDEAEDEAGTDTVPPERMWEALAEAACGVVDGGSLPLGCPTTRERGQVVVVPPDCVTPAQQGRGSTPLPPDGRHSAALVGDGVARRALRRAQRALAEADPPLAIDPDKVSRTAVRLCADLARTDRESREQQSGGLAMDPPAAAAQLAEDPAAAEERPLATPSLLDRIRERVLGDRLSALLDAERWTRMATAPVGAGLAVTGWSADSPSEALRDDEGRFRRRVGLAAGLALGLLALWTWAREHVQDFFANTVGWVIPVWFGFVVAALVLVVGALVAAMRLYGAYTAFLERGRRLLEARRGLEVNAREAWTAYNRLTNVDAILARWCRVLGSVLEARTGEQPAEGLGLPVLPAALRFAEPVIEERDLMRAMAEHGASAGWRREELQSLVEMATSVKDMDSLVGDLGFVSGPLDRLVRELEGGEPQERSRRRHLAQLVRDTRMTLAGRDVRVPRISDPAECDTLTAHAFMEEIVTAGESYAAGEDAGMHPGPVVATQHHVFVSASRRDGIAVTERVTDVAVRVSMTPHERPVESRRDR
ncbi:MAG: hypothetical protein EOL89_00190 [Actinobacteria bacterium]|nr:hypothetical protein [Actinomycetota bacterium]